MDSHKERLLFTKDDWSIYKAEYVYANRGRPDPARSASGSGAGNEGYILAYAHHQGCIDDDDGTYGEPPESAEPVNCWHTGDSCQRCILCNADVPVGIQALIVMYQWEK